MLRTEIITDAEAFAALKGEWGALHERDGGAFFLGHDWLHSWWETFGAGRDLFSVVCRAANDGRIVAALPAFCERGGEGRASRRTLRLLGSESVSSDFLDLLADPASHTEVMESLGAALADPNAPWDVLDFDALDANGKLPALLRAVAGDGAALGLIAEEVEEAPAIDLPPSWDDYLRTLSAKMRSNIRYSRKALGRSGRVELEKIDAPEQIEEALGDAIRLRSGWSAARGYAPPCPPTLYADFHRRLWRRLLPRGEVRLRFLRLDGRRVAFAYLLRRGESLYYYQTAFDQELLRQSVGTVLLGYVLEEAIGEGFTRFEFLRGREAYKYKWGEVIERPQTRMRLYGAASRRRYRVDAALNTAKRIARGVKKRVRNEG